MIEKLVLMTLLILLILSPALAQQYDAQWYKYYIVGKFTNSNPPKPDLIFIVQYRVVNGSVVKISSESEGSRSITFEIESEKKGTLEVKMPRNYPYTNTPYGSLEPPMPLVIINGSTADVKSVGKSDCFFESEIPFSRNSEISLVYSLYYISSLEGQVHGDLVPSYCLNETIATSGVTPNTTQTSSNIISNSSSGLSKNLVSTTVPEFPFAIPVMLIGLVSVIAFYQIRFGK